MFGCVRAAPASTVAGEVLGEPGPVDEFGPDDLQRDRLVRRLVEGDGDDRVGARRDHRFDVIAIGEGPPDEPVGSLGWLCVV